jgi:hypothetical protein
MGFKSRPWSDGRPSPGGDPVGGTPMARARLHVRGIYRLQYPRVNRISTV